ncbi:hypothetical protein V5799_012493, partial [Amblyomma americanum]
MSFGSVSTSAGVQVPCVGINATLARKYASGNYSEKDAVAVSHARTGSTVLVPAAEYDAMRRTCLNVTETAAEQFLRFNLNVACHCVHSNILKLVWADFCFSLVAGCMAFALHGHATILYGLELDDVVTAGYEYAFVSFPESVKDTNYSQLWCIAFYFLLSMLAFNGV